MAGEAEYLKLERDDFFDGPCVITEPASIAGVTPPLISIIFSRVFFLATSRRPTLTRLRF